MRSKYQILLRILDKIREEAIDTKFGKKYAVGSSDEDEISAARSRAYIHLYLKVMFGIGDFVEREQYVTDGSGDGGIDGFFIDRESKGIFLLQSKFRVSESNFEKKSIQHEEILAMDIDRITSGKEENEQGARYNGKILGLIRQMSEISDIARYSYRIVIIANCDISQPDVRRLTGGFSAEIFDHAKVYSNLIFPILSGTYYKATDLTIKIDLSNKSAGAKTSYSVSTPAYDCEITVLFVPTLEIARAMDKYRNSILEYNPRSYLDLDGQSVNAAIKETLLRPDSNEFALMNNGLTILSDETNINERIGQHNKAQLRLLNPQIINGGQTAYTLSRAYSEDRQNIARFDGKEVLVKVITLTQKDPAVSAPAERKRLIDEISSATNRQTTVISTDKLSNESVHIALQTILFERFGLLYERKRGEFSDGVFAAYIDRSQILDRAIFMRVLLTAYGKVGRATRKKIFAAHGLSDGELTDAAALQRFATGYEIFKKIAPSNTKSTKGIREALVKVYIGLSVMEKTAIDIILLPAYIERVWRIFQQEAAKGQRDNRYMSTNIDRATGKFRTFFNVGRWMAGPRFDADLKHFVDRNSKAEPPWELSEDPVGHEDSAVIE